MTTFPVQEKFEGRPSEDTTNRCPSDRLLRNHGFAIAERKRNGEPIWKRGNDYFVEWRAREIAAIEEAEKKKKLAEAV